MKLRSLFLVIVSAIIGAAVILLRSLLQARGYVVVNTEEVAQQIEEEAARVEEGVLHEIETATPADAVATLPEPERVHDAVERGRNRFHDSVRDILSGVRPDVGEADSSGGGQGVVGP